MFFSEHNSRWKVRAYGIYAVTGHYLSPGGGGGRRNLGGISQEISREQTGISPN